MRCRLREAQEESSLSSWLTFRARRINTTGLQEIKKKLKISLKHPKTSVCVLWDAGHELGYNSRQTGQSLTRFFSSGRACLVLPCKHHRRQYTWPCILANILTLWRWFGIRQPCLISPSNSRHSKPKASMFSKGRRRSICTGSFRGLSGSPGAINVYICLVYVYIYIWYMIYYILYIYIDHMCISACRGIHIQAPAALQIQCHLSECTVVCFSHLIAILVLEQAQNDTSVIWALGVTSGSLTLSLELQAHKKNTSLFHVSNEGEDASDKVVPFSCPSTCSSSTKVSHPAKNNFKSAISETKKDTWVFEWQYRYPSWISATNSLYCTSRWNGFTVELKKKGVYTPPQHTTNH